MKNNTKIFLTILASMSLFLSACGKNENTLAKVGDKTITTEQFEAFAEFKRVNLADEKNKQAALDQYLEREALADAVMEEDVLNKGLIEAELNEFKKEMLISRYFDQYLKNQVSDEAVQNYYNSRASDYEQSKVRVAHVLIRTNRNMQEAERQAKFTTAQEAHSKLYAGAEFSEVAEATSEDAVSAKKGGDLGWLQEGAIDPVFSKTVFSMKPGELSEVFETPFGFHIVKLVEGPLTVKRPFESVQGDIRYQLRNEAKKAELERLLSIIKIEKK